ncbi:hypothetical protein EV424DRAFT_1342866 [Suillus variegatus]|nr:hypothetical protein EV424DRAFT_1342866 [Suillus variegatus]
MNAISPGVMVVIHILMHLHYLMQLLHIDNNNLIYILAALDEFYMNKHEIITTGVSRFDLATGLLDDKLSIEDLEVVQEDHNNNLDEIDADTDIVLVEFLSKTQ